MISITNLTKKFGNLTAVEGLNIEIRKGELYGIIGPNGAGKTTVVRILCGALKPTEGTVKVNDLDMREHPLEIKAMLGYLPEEPNFYERLGARELLKFFARLYDVKHEDRIDELLDMVGLLDRGDSKISTFSKGMRQRLAIARALLHDPEVVILDEPTMGLDPESARSMRNFIADQKGKKTMLMCTHYMNEAEELCDRIGIMDKGKLLAEGTPGELKDMVRGEEEPAEISLEDVFVRLVRGR
ncbi:MAG: ABC transporter ATP-binding protein [Candidatus Hydrothermarchaeales archaeon]